MKHLKLDTRTPNVVYLRITTWVGSPVVMCAEHWYGKLSCGGSGYGADRVPPEEVEVEYVLTKKDAARLNKEDEWATYKAGGKSTRFFSKESLIDAALSCWKQHFPSTLLLIEGDPSVWEPQPILDGPSSLMARITTLWHECEELNWENHEHLLAQWERIWKKEVQAKKAKKAKVNRPGV